MSVRTVPELHGEDLDAWERAYLRFETSEEEQRKFTRRLRRAGADTWRRDALILDLFSGRGGGAEALRRLGFRHIVRVDLSSRLLRAASDASDASVGDCRQLPIAAGSIDIAIVQGGLHHLPRIPNDLAATLREIVRVLKPDGLFMAVEPWRTPFLDLVHAICAWGIARKASPKIDALARMIELERRTYVSWLGKGREILALLDSHFTRRQVRVRLGKLLYVGARR